jgi:type II secretory pathway pseudopilin PulG
MCKNRGAKPQWYLAGHVFPENSQLGMSLVAILVATGILGIVAVSMSRMFATQADSQKKLEMSVASMAVVRNLNMRLMEYCPPTTTAAPVALPWTVPPTCAAPPGGTYVEIKSTSGAILIKMFDPAAPLTAQQMGDLLVRAKCIANPHKILKVEAVDAKWLTNNKDTPWFNISPKIPLACDIDR